MRATIATTTATSARGSWARTRTSTDSVGPQRRPVVEGAAERLRPRSRGVIEQDRCGVDRRTGQGRTDGPAQPAQPRTAPVASAGPDPVMRRSRSPARTGRGFGAPGAGWAGPVQRRARRPKATTPSSAAGESAWSAPSPAPVPSAVIQPTTTYGSACRKASERHAARTRRSRRAATVTRSTSAPTSGSTSGSTSGFTRHRRRRSRDQPRPAHRVGPETRARRRAGTLVSALEDPEVRPAGGDDHEVARAVRAGAQIVGVPG